MPQPNVPESVSREGRLVLAISALKKNQFQSVRCAAETYDVPRSTLQTRRVGVTSRRDCEANSKQLTELEEEVVTKHILDLDSRGFAPQLIYVREMADQLAG